MASLTHQDESDHRTRLRTLMKQALTILSALSFLAIAGQAFGQVTPGEGTLSAKVVLVARDLSLRPVPKRAFSIRSSSVNSSKLDVTSSLSGDLIATLP